MGDKLGIQLPACCTVAQEKTHVALNVRENASFSDVVDILENAQVAGTGFEVPLVFRGKTYFVIRAGDAGGIFSAVGRRQERDQRPGHTA